MPKIALVQMEIIPGHPELNTEKILKFISQAKAEGASLIIFPESAVPGNYIGDTRKEIRFASECDFFGKKIIAASTGIGIMFGNISPKGARKIFAATKGTLFSAEGVHAEVASDEISLDEERPFSCHMASVPFRLGARAEREKKILNHLQTRHRPQIFVNAMGIQNKGKTIYVFDGASMVYNSFGEIVLRGEPFKECLHCLELDEIDELPPLEESEPSEAEEIYRAVSYGVEKFLRQINMKKVVIGISGGIDSAVAAALYTKILGAENVLLVNMPSVFNSATTRGLSEQLAKNLGCKYAVVPIQESVDFTVKQLESTPINFLAEGTSEQIKISSFVRENIQARDRSGRILATLAAAVGGGFTCNANKAETTVGYATLYGDEAGVLCALADLWKFQIYALARYLNEEVYRREVIPQGIIDIVPSAELSSAQNVDEGKGDPLKYPYHDYLFRAFMEKSWSPERILEFYAEGTLEEEIGCAAGLVQKYFPTAKDFVEDLERWWKLFTGMAVAKRIQSPPILAVSKKAYGSDFAESQNIPHFTRGYEELKKKVISDK